MSEKGLYKRAVDPWSDDVKEHTRAKENKMFGDIKYNTRRSNFDYVAFKLSDGNTFELSRMLYSSKVQDSLTRYFDKLLERRIREIKATNFMLPQTSLDTIRTYSETQNIRGHNVPIVKASDIPDFYAYLHTPEAAFASNNASSRNKKISNFEIFKQLGDEKVICASYVGDGKYGAAKEHGLILNIDSNKTFVGYGHDIYSCAKNQQDMIIEYFLKDNMAQAASGKGLKAEHRAFISKRLKEFLGISDDEYIKRLDRIKAQINNKSAGLAEIEKIDPEFGAAYRKLLSIDNSGLRNSTGLLRKDSWNELLVSNPEMIAIYTKNIEELPKEYLQLAEENNIPIVILK